VEYCVNYFVNLYIGVYYVALTNFGRALYTAILEF